MKVTKLRTWVNAYPQSPASVETSPWSSDRVYAICFDLNQAALARHYKGAYPRNAYDEIKRELAAHGFQRQQGSVFFGDRGTDPVACVLAVQALDKRFAWFRWSVEDLRMLRIEENNDLMPALGQGELPLDKSSAA